MKGEEMEDFVKDFVKKAEAEVKRIQKNVAEMRSEFIVLNATLHHYESVMNLLKELDQVDTVKIPKEQLEELKKYLFAWQTTITKEKDAIDKALKKLDLITE